MINQKIKAHKEVTEMIGFTKKEYDACIDFVANTSDERNTIFRYFKEDHNLSIIQFVDKEMAIVDIALEEFCLLGEQLLKELAPRLKKAN